MAFKLFKKTCQLFVMAYMLFQLADDLHSRKHDKSWTPYINSLCIASTLISALVMQLRGKQTQTNLLDKTIDMFALVTKLLSLINGSKLYQQKHLAAPAAAPASPTITAESSQAGMTLKA